MPRHDTCHQLPISGRDSSMWAARLFNTAMVITFWQLFVAIRGNGGGLREVRKQCVKSPQIPFPEEEKWAVLALKAGNKRSCDLLVLLSNLSSSHYACKSTVGHGNVINGQQAWMIMKRWKILPGIFLGEWQTFVPYKVEPLGTRRIMQFLIIKRQTYIKVYLHHFLCSRNTSWLSLRSCTTTIFPTLVSLFLH